MTHPWHGAKSCKCEKKTQQKDCGYWKMYFKNNSRKEPSATAVLQPKVSAQAGTHYATQYTWNALPLHPAKPPRLPPTNCSGNFLSAVFPTRCEKNMRDGKGGRRIQANSQLSPLSSKSFFKYHLFVIHKRKKIFGKVRYRGRLQYSSAVMEIITDRDTYTFLISKYFTYLWENVFST